MQPNRLGRVLGIGARVAADKLRERTAQAASVAPRTSSSLPVAAPSPRQNAANAAYAEGARRLARGSRQAGAAFFRPFAHASGILWNQIVGLFFAIFALFFLSHAWQVFRSAGIHDRHLPIYGAIGLIFAWFTASSFWRARKKQQQMHR
jgi:hypothetical protein